MNLQESSEWSGRTLGWEFFFFLSFFYILDLTHYGLLETTFRCSFIFIYLFYCMVSKITLLICSSPLTSQQPSPVLRVRLPPVINVMLWSLFWSLWSSCYAVTTDMGSRHIWDLLHPRTVERSLQGARRGPYPNFPSHHDTTAPLVVSAERH